MKFKDWFKKNLKENARDIVRYGAGIGYPHITYTSDTVRIYNRFEADIWEMLASEAEELGTTIPGLIAGFNRVDMADTPEGFKNLLVWFACEHEARNMHPNA